MLSARRFASLPRWDRVRFWGYPILGGIVTGAAIVGLMVLIFYDTPSERRACDRVVATLLNTRDPVELQRTGILLRYMHCDVLRRVADALAP